MKALVKFFGDGSGRISPPMSGFSPQLEVGVLHTSCIIGSEKDHHVFSFDKYYEVEIDLRHQSHYNFKFERGDEMNLFEGSKKIGVLRIVDV